MRFVCAVAVVLVAAGAGMTRQTQEAASNPIPTSRESVTRGRNTYLRHCQDCHGPEGHGDSAIAAAADLTRPDTWKYGSTDAQVFNSIKNGAGDNMPSFKSDLKDDDIWELVNFIRSIGPKEK
jgi:copper resistance protein D